MPKKYKEQRQGLCGKDYASGEGLDKEEKVMPAENTSVTTGKKVTMEERLCLNKWKQVELSK